MSITFQQKNSDPFFLPNSQEAQVTINYMYSRFKEEGAPWVNVLRDVYMRFTIEQTEFEGIRLEAKRQIKANPQLNRLLRG